MFAHIYVPVDNSDFSNRAIDLAVQLGTAFGARLTGCHVYAARLHDYRFKQMEYTLPEEYRDEAELERQRKIHDSLIAMGLQLISESYLQVMRRKAEAVGLPFEARMVDGKHYRVLQEDIARSGCDLVVMGALGMGAVRDSTLGSVTERVTRRVAVDTLVVRLLDPLERLDGGILVAVDGSPASLHGLRVGLALGRALGRAVQTVTVAEGCGDADTARATTRLDQARTVAREVGVELPVTLLHGKPFDRILQFVRKERPWLLVLGRTGAGADPGDWELGSTAANLLRLAPTNVYLGGRADVPRA